MALKGMDGFDLYAIGDITDFWQSNDANSTIVEAAGRCSSYAYRNTGAGGGGPTIGVDTAETSGYCGWAYYPEDINGVNIFFVVNTSATGIVFLRSVSSGAIEFWVGPNTTLGTMIGTTATGLLATGHYTHLGFEWNIHDTLGYGRIYVEGIEEYDSGNVDTTDSDSGSTTWVAIKPNPKGYLDDIYWGDTDESDALNPYSEFLGDLRVEGQFALTDLAGGGGTYDDFTPSASTDHGALVDERPPDDGTTYVEGDTVGETETFQFPDITLGYGTVIAVQNMPNMVKTDAGSRGITNVMHVGGTLYDGNIQYGIGETSYRYYPEVFAYNPDTSAAWTADEVNAAENGVQVTL